ncbi:MAG: cytochrome ubiquinol oxidase subunit I, partial [Chloroflexota bacterium]
MKPLVAIIVIASSVPNCAVAGMAMPLLMAIAGYRHLKTRDPLYADLARRWAKGTAILFAVGAVSG